MGHTTAVLGVAWSANGQLASGAKDGTILLWNLKTWSTRSSLGGTYRLGEQHILVCEWTTGFGIGRIEP